MLRWKSGPDRAFFSDKFRQDQLFYFRHRRGPAFSRLPILEISKAPTLNNVDQQRFYRVVSTLWLSLIIAFGPLTCSSPRLPSSRRLRRQILGSPQPLMALHAWRVPWLAGPTQSLDVIQYVESLWHYLHMQVSCLHIWNVVYEPGHFHVFNSLHQKSVRASTYSVAGAAHVY